MYVVFDTTSHGVLLYSENNDIESFSTAVPPYKWVSLGLWETFTCGSSWELVICDSWSILHDDMLDDAHKIAGLPHEASMEDRLAVASDWRIVLQAPNGTLDFKNIIEFTIQDYGGGNLDAAAPV